MNIVRRDRACREVPRHWPFRSRRRDHLPRACAHSPAQDWPNRPVHVILPYAAGGSTDVAARFVGEYLLAFARPAVRDREQHRRQRQRSPWTRRRRARPTATRFMITTEALVSNPHVYKVTFDPLKDFVPVIQLSRQPVVIAVHPSLGVNTLERAGDALVKRDPGMGYGTGSGVRLAVSRMVMQWFARIAGIKVDQVAYRGGGQAINDLIAGHVKIGSARLDAADAALQHRRPEAPGAEHGDALANAFPTCRPSRRPDLPSLVFDQWIGVFVPPGTPAAIVSRLNAELNKALQEPAIRDNLLKAAQDPVGGSAEPVRGARSARLHHVREAGEGPGDQGQLRRFNRRRHSAAALSPTRSHIRLHQSPPSCPALRGHLCPAGAQGVL